jgi:YidC/Oxa1 family membrane protein insertase
MAILLMLVVAVLPGIFFKPKPSVRPPGSTTDTGRTAAVPAESTPTVAGPSAPAAPPAAQATPSIPSAPPAAPQAPADTVWVTGPLYRFGFTTRGARLVAAELERYQSFAPGDSAARVRLVPDNAPLLGLRLVSGPDTLSLADVLFTPDHHGRVDVARGDTVLTFSATLPGGRVSLGYHFDPQDYAFVVDGRVEGLGGTGAVLVVNLGEGVRSVEADPLSDYREYAVVTKADKTQKVTFSSLDPGERKIEDGPFEWVALKSKYFFTAIMARQQGARPFAGVIATGMERTPVQVHSLFGTRTSALATRASVLTTLALPPSGTFGYELYAGPFEHQRLSHLGHGLDDANPYGWSIFRPIIHPVSLAVVNILGWMHDRLSLPYGWVLVFFGILVRLLLWPLQARAMESQMRMQAVQPLMQEIQTRYKGDSQKLQSEMLKLYKEHKVNPFGGCLPMLLPMPVLLALFFVFSNSIEFRGVPFLWLPDLSRADPLYIIPVVMGVSMFFVSKISQRGLPPNPQAKTMLYIMPAMMTFIFLRLASGLNLYYAVQNLISVPQQLQISKRRLAAQRKS